MGATSAINLLHHALISLYLKASMKAFSSQKSKVNNEARARTRSPSTIITLGLKVVDFVRPLNDSRQLTWGWSRRSAFVPVPEPSSEKKKKRRNAGEKRVAAEGK